MTGELIMGIVKTLFSKNALNLNFLNGKKLSRTTSKISLEEIDNVFKLIYKLFLYSVLGFFAKIFAKVFKFL